MPLLLYDWRYGLPGFPPPKKPWPVTSILLVVSIVNAPSTVRSSFEVLMPVAAEWVMRALFRSVNDLNRCVPAHRLDYALSSLLISRQPMPKGKSTNGEG